MELITTAAGLYTPPGDSLVLHTSAFFGSTPATGRPEPVHITQYDKTLPILAVELWFNGTPCAVPAGAAVNVRLNKPDGHVVYNPALGVNTSRTVAYVGITPQMTTAAGRSTPILEIVKGNGVAGTSAVALEIAPNPVPEEAIDSTDEMQSLAGLVDRVIAASEAALGSASAAQASASAAAGSAASASSSASSASASAAAAGNSAGAAESAKTAAESAASSAQSSKADAAASQTAAKASENAAREYAQQVGAVVRGGRGYFASLAALTAQYPTGEPGDWAILGDTDSIWVWDGDTSAWVNSAASADLSGYYTMAQMDERLDGKVDAEDGKGLSANDFTDAEKTKLQNIEAGAQVNPAAASTSAAGLMSAADKAKLDGIEDGAQANPTSLKNPKSMTVSLNGESLGSYNGSAAKTFSIVTSIYKEAGSHNATFRGTQFSGGVTAAQYAAISSGEFDDLYIGDYWTIDGINYRIAAFDYYYRSGESSDSNFITHHLVIVPDTPLYNAKMNTSNITEGGYLGSVMYTANLEQAKTTIRAAFPAHVLTHKIYLINTVDNGRPHGGLWVNSDVDLMNEQMVYGGAIFAPASDGFNVPSNTMVEKSQLPLFTYRPDLISNRQSFWLRDVLSGECFARVSGYGVAYSGVASGSYGVRPAFCIG